MQTNNTGALEIIRPFTKKRSEREVRDGLPALWPRLWRYALVLTKDRAEAEDLAQAACLRAMEKAELFTPGTRLDAWVMRILHRLWLNERRSSKYRAGAGLVSVDDIELPSNCLEADQNIFHAQVLSRVMGLPEAQRETVLLAYLEGYKYQEVAEMLDIPIGTVMSRLAAARATLSAELTDGDT
jgi:RNA polymerase sigma-70 factor (ECF subfamily)